MYCTNKLCVLDLMMYNMWMWSINFYPFFLYFSFSCPPIFPFSYVIAPSLSVCKCCHQLPYNNKYCQCQFHYFRYVICFFHVDNIMVCCISLYMSQYLRLDAYLYFPWSVMKVMRNVSIWSKRASKIVTTIGLTL